jgi:hypothetical protein
MHNEELHNLYSWPNIIRMKNSGPVALIEEKRNAYKTLGESQKEKDH